MLLAGNGFGTGATKLMRAFYGRPVTLSYLATDTDQIQRFVDYKNRRRLAQCPAAGLLPFESQPDGNGLAIGYHHPLDVLVSAHFDRDGALSIALL
jgi:hypothetical protein